MTLKGKVKRMLLAAFATVALMMSPSPPAGSTVQATHLDPAYLASIALNAASGFGTTFGPETAVNTVTNRIYVADGKTGSVNVVDGATRALIAGVPIGVTAIHIAVNEVTNRIYAANWEQTRATWPCCSTVAVIDGDTNAVVATVRVNGHPSGLAADAVNNRVYVANFINVQVIDGQTNTVVASFGAGSNEHTVAVNPVTGRLYIAATYLGNTTVNVFDTTSYALVASFPLAGIPRRFRMNVAANKLYAAGLWDRTLQVIDGATDTVVVTEPIGSGSYVYDMAIDEAANRVYVAWFVGSPRSGIATFDGATGKWLTRLPGPGTFIGSLAFNGITGRLFASGGGEITYLNDVGCLWEVGDGPETLDLLPPNVGTPVFSLNPKSVSQTSILRASADDPSGIGGGRFQLLPEGIEYGPLVPMTVDGSEMTAEVDASWAPGVYTARVQARDAVPCSLWSPFSNRSEYFVIFDPDGAFVTGAGSIIPGGQSSDSGDALPGLDSTSRAQFGFVVNYQNGAATTPGGRLDFRYGAGRFTLQSVGLDWLVTNSNQIKFQGTASIDGEAGIYPFRVEARDGDAHGGSQSDRFVIKVYAPGVDPGSASPVYRASGDLASGQIVIHSTNK